MKAGFAEIDITPPVGTHKIGWLKDIVSDSVRDPLFARCAVLEQGAERVAFIQLDLLCIRWTQVADLRRRIQSKYSFPGDRIMVSATHNHAGPAVATIGDAKRDEGYIESLMQKVVVLFGAALKARKAAEMGFATVFDFDLGHNRRILMRDGTVRTHGTFNDPNALCVEGPMDPEAAVLGVRDLKGRWLGMLVNYACHPTHLGGDQVLSGGFPGEFSRVLKAQGVPVALFINGAAGNIHHNNPTGGRNMGLEEAGQKLAADALAAVPKMKFSKKWKLGGAKATVKLPYRKLTKAELAGTIPGAQRFVDPAIYERTMPGLVARIKERKTQPAEVQVLRLGDVLIAGIPAEYFVEHGLRIKEACHPAHALVAGFTNGMVGYVPTAEAFKRSGYETTLGPPSKLAPEAGDLLADAAIRLIRRLSAV
jgi:neutral ceramidase